MELREAIHGRRTVRAFTPEPVRREAIEALIEAAIQAPSAVNEQSWHFTVVQSKSLLDSLAERIKGFMIKAMEDGTFAYHQLGHLKLPDFQVFHDAPALLLVSARAGDWAIENASVAAQNVMLTAHDLGLGSCWIGFAQRWLDTRDGRAALQLGRELVPVAPIVIGHPAGKAPPVARRPASVRWVG